MTHTIPSAGAFFRSSGAGKWISRPIKKPRAGTGHRPNPPPSVATLGRYLKKLRAMPAIRWELVDRVRAEMAAGTYRTADKIAALVDHLANDLRS